MEIQNTDDSRLRFWPSFEHENSENDEFSECWKMFRSTERRIFTVPEIAARSGLSLANGLAGKSLASFDFVDFEGVPKILRRLEGIN